MLRNYLVPYNRKIENDPLFNELTYGHKSDLNTVNKDEYLFFHTKIMDKRYITAFYKVFDKKTVKEIQQDRFLRERYNNPHINHGQESDTIVFGHPIYSYVLERPVPLDDTLLKYLVNDKQIKQKKLVMEKDSKEYLIEYLMQFQQTPLQDTKLTTSDIYHLREYDIESFLENNPEALESNLTLVKRQKQFLNKSRLDLLFKDEQGIYVVVEIKKGLIEMDTYQQLEGYVNTLKNEQSVEKVRGIIVCRGFASEKSKDFYSDKIKAGKLEIFLHAWKFDLKEVSSLDLLDT